MTNNAGHPPPEQQESAQQSREAPAPDAGASPPVPVNVNVDVSGVEQAAGNIRTRDRERGREWTRRALIVGIFILFLVVFGVASYAALQSDEPFNNAFEVVQYFAPVVTALGGYIAGHYFLAQSPPQTPEGGGSGGQQG